MKEDKVLEVLIKYEKLFLTLARYTNYWLHHTWMIEQIRGFLSNGDLEKAMRWLGFIQGCLFTKGVYTIQELRGHNREEE